MVIVVMGVSGAGKSTVGALLAQRLGYRFFDADSVHSQENLAKMAAGIPLTDADREPWLGRLAQEVDGFLLRGEDVVLASSLLKRAYREKLMRDPARMRLVYLRGTPELLDRRLRARVGHVVGAALLNSQLEILEEPQDAITVDVDAPLPDIIERILVGLRSTEG